MFRFLLVVIAIGLAVLAVRAWRKFARRHGGPLLVFIRMGWAQRPSGRVRRVTPGGLTDGQRRARIWATIASIAAPTIGLLMDLWLTITALVLATAFVFAVRRATRSRRLFHSNHIKPLHEAIAADAGHHEGTRPKDYLAVSRESATVTGRVVPKEITVGLTPAAAGSEAKVRRLVHSVPTVAGLGASIEVMHRLDGPAPALIFRVLPPPLPIPRYVSWAQALPYLLETPPGQVLLGFSGEDEDGTLVPCRLPVAAFVHAINSAKTGAGKSSLTTIMGAKFRYDGNLLISLDATGRSFPWARNLPGVYYPSGPEGVRKALNWLEDRRVAQSKYEYENAEYSGYVEMDYGPDVMALADERNVTEMVMNSDYQERSGKSTGRDPSLRNLDKIHFAGRKLGIHAVVPMVRADANAQGGGAVRGQAGLVIFGALPSKAEWDMFFKGEDRPVSADADHKDDDGIEVGPPKGRMWVCYNGQRTEIQVPHCLQEPAKDATPEQIAFARQLAEDVRAYILSGKDCQVPAELADDGILVPDRHNHQQPQRTGQGERADADALIALREAIETGLVTSVGHAGLRTQSKKDDFPEVRVPGAGRNGAMYLRSELEAWEASRGADAPTEELGTVLQFRRKEEESDEGGAAG